MQDTRRHQSESRCRWSRLLTALVSVIGCTPASVARQSPVDSTSGAVADACPSGVVDIGHAPRGDPQCMEIGLCQTFGRCHYDAPNDDCTVSTAADCQRSEFCRLFGDCDLIGAQCGASSASGCPAHVACKLSGKCTAVGPNCVPTESSHCAASLACREFGDCQFVEKSCGTVSETACNASASCRTRGKCHFLPRPGSLSGICVPTAKSDCLNSVECARAGACGFDPSGDSHQGVPIGRCHTDQSVKCSAQLACFEDGRCVFSAKQRSCVAGSVADCQASSGCLREGKCLFRNQEQDCVMP